MTTEKRGLQIRTLEQQAAEAAGALTTALTADRRLWLDATQTKLVEDGDPAARFQLAAPGHRIPVAEAKRLGLHMHEGRVEQDAPAEGEASEGSATDEKTAESIGQEPEAKKPKTKKRTPAENK